MGILDDPTCQTIFNDDPWMAPDRQFLKIVKDREKEPDLETFLATGAQMAFQTPFGILTWSEKNYESFFKYLGNKGVVLVIYISKAP